MCKRLERRKRTSETEREDWRHLLVGVVGGAGHGVVVVVGGVVVVVLVTVGSAGRGLRAGVGKFLIDRLLLDLERIRS